METTWVPYDTEIEVLFPAVRTVREFAGWRVCATDDGAFRLVVDDRRQKHATVWEYECREEQKRDIELVLHLPDDGGPAAAPVPAFVHPGPPSRHASDAKPLPGAQE